MAAFVPNRNLSTNPRVYHSGKHNTHLADIALNYNEFLADYNTLKAALEAEPFTTSIPLSAFREVDANGDVANIAANGGILASDTTPIYQSLSPASDADNALVVHWASSNNDVIGVNVVLDADVNVDSDIVVHFRIVSGGTNDAVGFSMESFFNEGDSKITDVSGTNQTTTWAEVTATIAAADVPAGAQTLTINLVPNAHTNDLMKMSSCWITGVKSRTLA